MNADTPPKKICRAHYSMACSTPNGIKTYPHSCLQNSTEVKIWQRIVSLDFIWFCTVEIGMNEKSNRQSDIDKKQWGSKITDEGDYVASCPSVQIVSRNFKNSLLNTHTHTHTHTQTGRRKSLPNMKRILPLLWYKLPAFNLSKM